MGHATGVCQRKLKLHPSQVPSGHLDGKLMVPLPRLLGSQLSEMTVVRPWGHDLVALPPKTWSKSALVELFFTYIGVE